jgi:hypothetical protein
MSVKITQNGIDTIQDNIVNNSKIIDNSIFPQDLPFGTPIQIVRTFSTSRGSFVMNTSDTAVPNMAVTITPKLSNSRFLIMIRFLCEADNQWDNVWNIQRNGTRINTDGSTFNQFSTGMAKQTYAGAENNSSTPEIVNFRTWDISGSTAGESLTFRLVCSSGDARNPVYYNGDWGLNNTDGNETSTSEIIVMEYKG